VHQISTSDQPTVALENVSVEGDGQLLLDDVTLTCKAKKVYALTGPRFSLRVLLELMLGKTGMKHARPEWNLVRGRITSPHRFTNIAHVFARDWYHKNDPRVPQSPVTDLTELINESPLRDQDPRIARLAKELHLQRDTRITNLSLVQYILLRTAMRVLLFPKVLLVDLGSCGLNTKAHEDALARIIALLYDPQQDDNIDACFEPPTTIFISPSERFAKRLADYVLKLVSGKLTRLKGGNED
jgi:hypothetical protein